MGCDVIHDVVRDVSHLVMGELERSWFALVGVKDVVDKDIDTGKDVVIVVSVLRQILYLFGSYA